MAQMAMQQTMAEITDYLAAIDEKQRAAPLAFGGGGAVTPLGGVVVVLVVLLLLVVWRRGWVHHGAMVGRCPYWRVMTMRWQSSPAWSVWSMRSWSRGRAPRWLLVGS